MSLNNLNASLSGLGRLKDALAGAQLAISIFPPSFVKHPGGWRAMTVVVR
jgi:hypothetical protein